MSDISTVRPTEQGYVPVAALRDIPVGWVLKTGIGSRQVALANCEGTIHAFDNSCSHAGGPLGDNRLKDGCFVECPWHNSIFDVRSGEAVSGAARKPVAKFDVKVDGEVVYLSADLTGKPGRNKGAERPER